MKAPAKTAAPKKRRRAPTPAETAAPILRAECGCCSEPCPLDRSLFCAGCKCYICERATCTAPAMGLGHEPWRHKPCDICGEPVNDPGAALCERCE